MVERIFIGLLALAGFLISLYFTVVHRKPIPAIERYVPTVCRIDPATCASLLATPEARLFGIPNFHLGLLFYTGLIGSVLLSNVWRQLHLMLFLGSLVTVLMGGYLTYVLLVRWKVRCTLCLASHAINLLMFLLLLVTV